MLLDYRLDRTVASRRRARRRLRRGAGGHGADGAARRRRRGRGGHGAADGDAAEEGCYHALGDGDDEAARGGGPNGDRAAALSSKALLAADGGGGGGVGGGAPTTPRATAPPWETRSASRSFDTVSMAEVSDGVLSRDEPLA